jgi:hypothetical protein
MNELYDVLNKGNQNRNIASTNINQTSSRSHTAIIVNISNIADSNNNSNTNRTIRESSLVLVDLAGSERSVIDYMVFVNLFTLI